MKFLLVAVLFVSISVVFGVPDEGTADSNIVEFEYLHEGSSNLGVRQRRVTCDLLSFGGYVSDSACAANCLSMGKAGGRCNGGVCQCRVTKIKDLWDKRTGR